MISQWTNTSFIEMTNLNLIVIQCYNKLLVFGRSFLTFFCHRINGRLTIFGPRKTNIRIAKQKWERQRVIERVHHVVWIDDDLEIWQWRVSTLLVSLWKRIVSNWYEMKAVFGREYKLELVKELTRVIIPKMNLSLVPPFAWGLADWVICFGLVSRAAGPRGRRTRWLCVACCSSSSSSTKLNDPYIGWEYRTVLPIVT